ncbi:hypothetical protein HYPSUDRAFT_219439 [Hypholoma sublateritium FD-334 SS-4]|uniref:Mandelate racemase/muconate lactonizing enzyme N-terminal domain-containing protein n=1 Tax=Hypholoma sublateritium (strain FD-334 SS-4) TaxID=945553 RepID=A0A0D2LZY4_HYPSF|nr:hypothetical protein HYPSUDRAFT_219439 [Hypholoma sublateritium FD-334 SS-4]
MAPSTIAKIKTFLILPCSVGWGEATFEGHNEGVKGTLVNLQRFVDGRADRPQDIWQTGLCGHFYVGSPVLMRSQSTLSGLNIAVWDIKGKALGSTVRDRMHV